MIMIFLYGPIHLLLGYTNSWIKCLAQWFKNKEGFQHMNCRARCLQPSGMGHKFTIGALLLLAS